MSNPNCPECGGYTDPNTPKPPLVTPFMLFACAVFLAVGLAIGIAAGMRIGYNVTVQHGE